jgi:hypothetical protein
MAYTPVSEALKEVWAGPEWIEPPALPEPLSADALKRLMDRVTGTSVASPTIHLMGGPLDGRSIEDPLIVSGTFHAPLLGRDPLGGRKISTAIYRPIDQDREIFTYRGVK